MRKTGIVFLLIHCVLTAKSQTDSAIIRNLDLIVISTQRFETNTLGGRTDSPDSSFKAIYNLNTLATLIEMSSGMGIKSYGAGSLATSTLRGGNAQQTAVNWNGIAVNSPVNGLSDFNLIPSFLFDQIALMPGAAASIQGNAAISGGLNLSNSWMQNPRLKNGLQLEWMQTIGSFGQLSSGVKCHLIKNKWRSNTRLFNNYSRNNYPFTNTAEPDFPRDTLHNAEVKLFSALHETNYLSKRVGNFKIAYWGTLAHRFIPPTMIMESTDASQVDRIQKGIIQWEIAHKSIKYLLRSSLQDDYLKYGDLSLNINSKTKSRFWTNEASMRFSPFKNAIINLGFIHSSIKAKVINDLEHDKTLYNQSQRQQTAFWLNHFHTFFNQKLKLNAALRKELVDGKFIPWIPSIGFRMPIAKPFECYGQLTRVYRLPTLNDLHWIPGGNPDLQPESGINSELSLQYHYLKKNSEITLSVTGYYRNIHNWIQWQPLSTQIWTPYNIGLVNSKGLEFRGNIKLNFNTHWQLHTLFNADYCESVSKDKTTLNYGNQLIYVPKFKGSGSLGLNYRSTSFLISGLFNSKRYVSSDHLIELPAYGIVNCAVSQFFKLNQTGISIILKANNLFNSSYQVMIWRPMPGRSYEFGINIGLHKRFKSNDHK